MTTIYDNLDPNTVYICAGFVWGIIKMTQVILEKQQYDGAKCVDPNKHLFKHLIHD